MENLIGLLLTLLVVAGILSVVDTLRRRRANKLVNEFSLIYIAAHNANDADSIKIMDNWLYSFACVERKNLGVGRPWIIRVTKLFHGATPIFGKAPTLIMFFRAGDPMYSVIKKYQK